MKYVKRGQLFINHLAATDPTTSEWDTFYKPSNSANKRIVWLWPILTSMPSKKEWTKAAYNKSFNAKKVNKELIKNKTQGKPCRSL